MPRWPVDYQKKTKSAPKPVGRPKTKFKCTKCGLTFTGVRIESNKKPYCTACAMGESKPEKQTPTTTTNLDLEPLQARISTLEYKVKSLEGVNLLHAQHIFSLQQCNNLPWWKRWWK